MDYSNIYSDIVLRTHGDIYLGVVGPVRVGKSTFISKFMQNLVLPNISNANVKARAIDEMPQSAEGKTIMTTQPKFVPNEAVSITVNKIKMNVRLIDCVGYFVPEAQGNIENNKPRLVKTPWSEEKMPLEKAAEIGTFKVISEHSSVGVLVTSDGSFGEIKRESFEKAEERVARELKSYNKPSVIVLNSSNPKSERTIMLAKELKEKYKMDVQIMDVINMNLEDINQLFAKMLNEFPLVGVDVKMPLWMLSLPFEHELIQEIVNEVKLKTEDIEKVGQFNESNTMFSESQNFEPLIDSSIKMGEGKIICELKPKENLFYTVLSEQCGHEIKNDFQLISYIQQLAFAKVEYDKIKDALISVEENGYGVVNPKFEDMILDEPRVVKQGGRYGVRIKASAPSLHILRVDLETELSPLVGSASQTEEFVSYLQKEYENNPKALWQTNVFGKTFTELITDGMQQKITNMPMEAQKKMRKTLTKIVNEGKGGIICILL